MSLTDVDKDNLDRGTPTVNSSDIVIDGANKAHKTISTHYKTDADANTGRIQMQNKQMLANDGVTPIGLYGYNQALGKWGFFVTKAGVDVTTNTDLSQFVFNSAQDIFKIVGSGTFTDMATHTTSNPGAGKFGGDTFSIATIPHGLSYVPAIIGYLGLSGGGYQPIPYTDYLSFTSSIALWYTWSITVDATNVNIILNTLAYGSSSGIGSGTTFKYYLLQETAL